MTRTEKQAKEAVDNLSRKKKQAVSALCFDLFCFFDTDFCRSVRSVSVTAWMSHSAKPKLNIWRISKRCLGVSSRFSFLVSRFSFFVARFSFSLTFIVCRITMRSHRTEARSAKLIQSTTIGVVCPDHLYFFHFIIDLNNQERSEGASCRVSAEPRWVPAASCAQCGQVCAHFCNLLPLIFYGSHASDVIANLAVAIPIVPSCTTSCWTWCTLPAIAPCLNARWFCRAAAPIPFQLTDVIRRIPSIPPTTTLRYGFFQLQHWQCNINFSGHMFGCQSLAGKHPGSNHS